MAKDTTTSTPSSASKKGSKRDRTSVCSYCNMTFNKKEHLQRHERTHTLDRPYVCEVPECGKTFARRDTLTRHQRLHKRDGDVDMPDDMQEAAEEAVEQKAEASQKPSKKARRARTNSTQSSSGGSVTVIGASASKAPSEDESGGSEPGKRESLSDSDMLATKTSSSTASSNSTGTTATSSGAISSSEGHEAISPAFPAQLAMDTDIKPEAARPGTGKTDIPTPPSSGFATAALLYDFASWNNQTRSASHGAAVASEPPSEGISMPSRGFASPSAPSTALGLDLGVGADDAMQTGFESNSNGTTSAHTELPSFVQASQKGFQLQDRPESQFFPAPSQQQHHTHPHLRSQSFPQPASSNGIHTFLASPQQPQQQQQQLSNPFISTGPANGGSITAPNAFPQQQHSFLASGASSRGYSPQLLQLDTTSVTAQQQQAYQNHRAQYAATFGTSLPSIATGGHARSYSVDDGQHYGLNTALLSQQQGHLQQQQSSTFEVGRPAPSVSPVDSAYLSLAYTGSPGSLGSPLTDISSNDYGSMSSSVPSLSSSLPTIAESFSSFYSYPSSDQAVRSAGAANAHQYSAFKDHQAAMSATISGEYAPGHEAGSHGGKLTMDQEYRQRMQKLLDGSDNLQDDFLGWSGRKTASPPPLVPFGLSPDVTLTSSDSSTSPTSSFMDLNDYDGSQSSLFGDATLLANPKRSRSAALGIQDEAQSPIASLEEWLIRQTSSDGVPVF